MQPGDRVKLRRPTEVVDHHVWTKTVLSANVEGRIISADRTGLLVLFPRVDGVHSVSVLLTEDELEVVE